MSKEEFTATLTGGMPTPPQYFFHDVGMNRAGAPTVESVLPKCLKALTYE
jgi:hypothetical protein